MTIQSERPLFSVLIPTRERAETLPFALRTVLEQRALRLEIVVMDNCSTDGTRDVVEGLRDPRLKYVRAPTRLSMQDNWELGLSHTSGDYVFVLGDDDGLMPDALEICERIVAERKPAIVAWRRYSYGWPNVVDDFMRDRLVMHLAQDMVVQNGRAQIEAFGRFAVSHELLPMIYNSFVRRDLIERIKSVHGRYFLGVFPDVYSGLVNAYFVGDYLLSLRALSLIGSSGRSIGASALNADRNPEEVRIFWGENRAETLHPDLRVGSEELEQAVVDMPELSFADMFLTARTRMYPNDERMRLDVVQLIHALGRGMTRYPKTFDVRRRYVEALGKRYGLGVEFPARPEPVRTVSVQGLMRDAAGNVATLIVNCAQAAVTNVFDASRLAQACLPRAMQP